MNDRTEDERRAIEVIQALKLGAQKQDEYLDAALDAAVAGKMEDAYFYVALAADVAGTEMSQLIAMASGETKGLN